MRGCRTTKLPRRQGWRAARLGPRWRERAADWSRPMMRDGKEDSMSHVDEGTLHAYLDGELPPSERSDVDAHLAQCAACAALLGEERALLERATALLGSTRPVERPAPPFQEVRRAQRRPPPWYAPRTLAWAASLMLAVGLGY